ncbi:HNH endonuclease signature motif containing protein [Actinomadura sp. DC4]|uniref:HNH endonuclease signature motif containing protein n=1 Tax=Actinomadura sp. DC4 TaxID=3055069 RepID=UPI0025B1FC66|nr:HNH endonuclease signature motif containing protein [Actinomadura sp. DC4]MDN3356878.1 DUF222 domain-containing protein [Actinomadura sp. DC4]
MFEELGWFFRGEGFVVNGSSVDSLIPLDGFVGVDASDGGLIEMMVEARRAVSRLQAVELAAVAELARRRDAEEQVSGAGVISAGEYVNDEVAAALTLTATSADELIRFAAGLTGRLPATFTALAVGDLDYARARALWQGLAQVGDEVAAEIEARVLARVAGQTTGEIRAKVRRLVRRLDPGALARRREHAELRRDVQLVATDDGTAHLTGLDLPADAATAARNRVNAIAAGLRSDGDRRAIGQLRADVFLGLLSGTLHTGEPSSDGTRRPAAVTPSGGEEGWTGVDDAVADAIARAARTQLGALSEHAVPERHQRLARLITQAGECIAGSLTGLKTRWCVPAPAPDPAAGSVLGPAPDLAADLAHGPVPGQAPDPAADLALSSVPGQAADPAPYRARGLAADLADGLAHGHRGYRVPAGMRRLIEKRDRRCGFPGCRRPVRHCDADHTIPYHRDGPTCPCNIAMLCRHHHSLKQTPGWRLQQLWPGVLLWTGPTGHWRITAPADRE